MTRLGSYELVRLVAQGGMADIYLARGDNNRLAAVKVLNDARASDPESCSLFIDEARLLGLLDHGNLAGVYEVDHADGVTFLAMEYVHGVDLRQLLLGAQKAERAIPYDAAIAIVAGAAAGLDHAHRRCDPDGRPLHLVHRDVSLSNIMVAHDGAVKVVDFGIARASVSVHHTNPGIVRGKASYMSPEQALGDDVDLRTDVFALGIVLYELTTGRRCFAGSNDFERMLAVVRGNYVPAALTVPGFPIALDRVIRKALATNLSQRYASAAALIEDLQQVAVAEGWTSGPAAIASLMGELFGDVTDPWLAAKTAEVTESAIIEEIAEAAPASTSRRRLARGTLCEANQPANDSTDDSDDDQPTRGRRSVPKMFVRVAA